MTISNELNHLSAQALRIAREHGFTEATPAEDMALITSEVSEALEAIREGRPLNRMHYTCKQSITYVNGEGDDVKTTLEIAHPGPGTVDGQLLKPCGVPSELADVIIRIAHFCGKHDIDIAQAVREKMAYNESRPFMHGKTL